MIVSKLIGSSLALVLLSAPAFAENKYSAGSYQVDASHSKVGFEVPHLKISSVEGRFKKFEGTVELAEKFEKSSVKVSVETGSIDTDQTKRDDHLKSPDFFDVAKFPAMKFESTEIKGKPDSFKLTGNLTIKGVTKKVTFDAKYTGTVPDGFGNEKAVFSAKTKINRKDFGLNWSNMVEAVPVVGDEVTINLTLEAARPLKK